MRLIGNLSDKKQVENFSAFLTSEGISNQIEPEGDGFEIWIKDEDSLETAADALREFQGNPSDQKYLEAVDRARKIQDEEIKKRQRIAKNYVPVKGGQVPRSHPLTIFLIFVSGLVAILTEFASPESLTKATYRALSFNAVAEPLATEILVANDRNADAMGVRLASFSRGEIWRIVTPIFIHFDIFHLIFNMYFLFMLGSQIENRYGSFALALLIVAIAALSNFFQGVVGLDIGGSAPLMKGEYLINLFGGMSGVNYGLLGFILMKMTYDRASGLFVPQSTVMILLVWLVFCMTPLHEQLMQSKVANWAHVIGLLAGVVAGYLPTLFRKRN